VASLGDNVARSAGYLAAFEQGVAQWYHMPLSTTVQRNVGIELMKQVRFCAFAVRHPNESHKLIQYVYEVTAIRLAPRNTLTVEQTGLSSAKTNDYWLLSLGNPSVLASPIEVTDDDAHFKLKTTDLAALKKGGVWSQLPAWFKGSI
jgi:hypothetical protein